MAAVFWSIHRSRRARYSSRTGRMAGGDQDGSEIVDGQVPLVAPAGVEGFVGEFAGAGGEVGDEAGDRVRLPQIEQGPAGVEVQQRGRDLVELRTAFAVGRRQQRPQLAFAGASAAETEAEQPLDRAALLAGLVGFGGLLPAVLADGSACGPGGDSGGASAVGAGLQPA
ncbi:hypothetical protein ADK57_05525 [Streptomyces sp. MMG1533]|nr:hypothetical protein ADK57_05525 [Streptomyces sp. MMG1533]